QRQAQAQDRLPAAAEAAPAAGGGSGAGGRGGEVGGGGGGGRGGGGARAAAGERVRAVGEVDVAGQRVADAAGDVRDQRVHARLRRRGQLEPGRQPLAARRHQRPQDVQRAQDGQDAGRVERARV